MVMDGLVGLDVNAIDVVGMVVALVVVWWWRRSRGSNLAD